MNSELNGGLESAGHQQVQHNPPPPPRNRPIRLKNHSVASESYDNLHRTANPESGCGTQVCRASIWHLTDPRLSYPAPCELDPEDEEALLSSAKEFLEHYYTSIKRLDTESHRARWESVRRDIHLTGTYDLTETELTFGAKLAWRNSARCIGRIQWAKLQVFDARHVTTAQGMFEALCNHIKYGTNKGNIRSAATVFCQRKPGQGDYRIWNAQLISYAGYRNKEDGTIVGDPGTAEFTEVCQKLGWVGAGTRFDLLPLVIQAGNRPYPEVFALPPELVLEVPLHHPTYDWFSELGLRWYALPAVSSMAFDCGGLQFTAVPFNGWYMTTEIATRDLGDTHRYNQLEVVAKRMGVDTRTHTSLWKDRAVIELNAAVLYSFQKMNVTIVDHHTASESFMKHMETETRLRGGCPAEWVWIVPPTSGSLTPVFHQEMVCYSLKPSYEYQEVAWKNFQWDEEDSTSGSALGLLAGGRSSGGRRIKYRFKEVARAVKFTSNLFGKALQRRIKAAILYATETGKSEKYAHMLAELFNHAFNAQVMCMADYDVINLEHEALVMIVTSTFGNGDPPENGEAFAREVRGMANNHHSHHHPIATQPKYQIGSSKSGTPLLNRVLNRDQHSLRSFSFDQLQQPSVDSLGPLSNVRFAVFALGSSAYPNFCGFGIYIDDLLGSLGGERLASVTCGDELSGQEQTFKSWAQQVFHTACETFCLEDDVNIDDVSATLRRDLITSDTVRFVAVNPQEKPIHDIVAGLSQTHAKNVAECPVVFNVTLAKDTDGRTTVHVGLKISNQWISGTRNSVTAATYEPGDHIGVFAVNDDTLVTGLIDRLGANSTLPPDGPLQLQTLTEHKDGGKTWQNQERLPACNLRTLLSHYLDITTPTSQTLLALLAAHASAEEDKRRLQLLATDAREYEDWKHWGFPHLLETLLEFPSVAIDAALLVSQLPLLQPRFYSISSSPLIDPLQIDITAAVIAFKTQGGKGPMHYGVCSNYLAHLKSGDKIQCFFRSAPNFHLPTEIERPVVMVGPGTGVAPFRGFWQHKQALQLKGEEMGPMLLFTGYRSPDCDLFVEEKSAMVASGILDYAFLALSRHPPVPKTYVQDKLLEAAPLVYRMLTQQKGHFYVCGDCAMAEDVANTLRMVFQKAGGLDSEESEDFLMTLRNERRYQEDIFGITYRAPDTVIANRRQQ
ncbi:nitric oxide synthase-like protein [Daphnia magna]|uniref:Nitric oxide synthase n=1 Tax=Daphnia magna TaxID=35525 RepID=C3UNG7_9CRUS|nr:nitric oxide synthase-like protein [Daphnia magna]XP_045033892.1 nitric oxide synthase-like protein [Daphnia magna]XP_045033893.1 nitric oxide synthase-like protein [Daphnia magna]XP_045033894.1 nitric oxide synthase-like protein [Daphnia magna]ACQ55298.1 nitric oxide synthase 1 [Daphnia magna]